MAKNKKGPDKKRSRGAPNELTRTMPIDLVPSSPMDSAPAKEAPATQASGFTVSVAAEVGALLLLPLIAFYLMRFVPINQNNFLDPYVYTGYINDFRDLASRYGLTYYSVRFGMIVPAQGFTQLFGPEGGYLAFRYALALIAGIPLYFMVKRQFSQPVAALAVAGLLTSPYFARALLWDYPDAAGVPFLTAAICLFLLDERPSLPRDALAGCCAAMAVNSNFFEITLVGIFGAVWLFVSLRLRRPFKELAQRIGGVALGGLVICFLGCVYYWHAFGRPTNIFAPSLGMASSLQKGGTRQWRVPGISWIATQIHVLIPVLLSVCCILVTRWRRATFTNLIVVWFGLTATAFYYVEQLLLDSDVLQLFYYFSYLTPAVFLMLAFLWQSLWEQTKRSAPVFVGLGLAVLLVPWLGASWGGWVLPNVTVSQWLMLGGVTIAGLVLGTREWRVPAMRIIMPCFGLILLGGCFTAGLANYSGLMRTRTSTKSIEMDVYRVALQFMHVVPQLAERPGVIKFWYNNRIGNSINSVQSTHLWGYSKLNTNPPEDPGLPHLGEFQLRLLRDPQVHFLGLLGESEEELSQGMAALTQQAIEFKTADHRVLASGDYRMYYQLVELTHGPEAVAR